MKKFYLALLLAIVLFVLPMTCFGGAKQIGEISLKGLMFTDKIQVLSFADPDMPFITIYLTTIKSGQPFAMADPSNNSIATRLTGKVGKLVKTTNWKVINLKKSIGWKTLKIVRFYDAPNKTFVYVTYSTKVIDGSYKHSMSVVPVGL